MLLSDLVAASAEIASTRSRKTKTAVVARVLGGLEPDEVEVVASYLSGVPRQRRTGLGWRGLSQLPEPAESPTLTTADVDDALEVISRLSGSGSRATRDHAVVELFGRATEAEQAFLRALVFENLRQGAQDAVLLEGIAAAAGVPVSVVRRAAMFTPSSGEVALAALTGGAAALEAIGLQPGRPLRPMLAASAPDIGSALEKMGAECVVDRKLDGIRVQVHRVGDEVRVFTRSLDDITERLPEVVEAAMRLPVQTVVLDGELIALGEDGRPRPFQETASRTGSSGDIEALRRRAPLTAYFFDVLHRDGRDLLDEPGAVRLAELDAVLPEELRIPRVVTDSPDVAQTFFEASLAAGHEGVVIKSLQSRYEAGRRGAGWVKVKPRHTLDLVVLAVEWGSGRRQGWLSNIHLGAADGSGGFVMLGKTFKGMTDEMLAWQTERFTKLAVSPLDMRDHNVVEVRPEQVVEIAFDGVQRSSRYPGGVALRFARVLRYRDDKPVSEIDTIDTVLTLGSR